MPVLLAVSFVLSCRHIARYRHYSHYTHTLVRVAKANQSSSGSREGPEGPVLIAIAYLRKHRKSNNTMARSDTSPGDKTRTEGARYPAAVPASRQPPTRQTTKPPTTRPRSSATHPRSSGLHLLLHYACTCTTHPLHPPAPAAPICTCACTYQPFPRVSCSTLPVTFHHSFHHSTIPPCTLLAPSTFHHHFFLPLVKHSLTDTPHRPHPNTPRHSLLLQSFNT